jgi:L-ribulokinase
VVVGVGAFDAHLGAVGAEIEPYYLSKVMGTSTCDMLIAPMEEVGDKLVSGICGQVDGSIVPGMLGLEAGQSAFGDIYAWFKRLLEWPLQNILAESALLDEATKQKLMDETSDKIIAKLSEEAAKIPIGESGIVALDWMNGRRTPDANQNLKGAIAGLNLGSDAPRIFRALVEATAFGSKAINDRFIAEGVRIDGVIALGGVAKKSPLVMQIVADVLNMPIKVARSEQACALGSAMAAAVAAGVYSNTAEAQKKMGGGIETEYHPIPENAARYKELYEKYVRFGKFVEFDF